MPIFLPLSAKHITLFIQQHYSMNLLYLRTFPLFALFPFALQGHALRHVTQKDTIKTHIDSTKTKSPQPNKDQNLGEATITATRLVFVTKKDTVIYDMDALGATKGDMLQDMISRMPGLEIKDGALYYRGKVVNRVLVNGTDFKRGDTKLALQNLPAYIIKSVKAYEDLTTEAKVTGIDDGSRERVINVILKQKYMGTWTGNADIGEGTDHRWLYRGFANTFTNHSRISAYGGFTNTAEYQSVSDNGDWNDNGGAGSSSGDTRYMQPGISFMWNNGKEEYKKGFFKITGAVDWDYRGHKDTHFSNNEDYLDDGSTCTTLTKNHSKNDERIWRGNFTLTWQPTDRTYVELQPQYGYTTNDDRTSKQQGQWNRGFTSNDNFASPLDSLLKYAAQGWPLNEHSANMLTRQESDDHSLSHSLGNWLYITHKLTDNNWRLSLRNQLTYSYSNSKRNSLESYQQYQQQQGQSMVDPLYNRYSLTNAHNFSLQNFVDLNIPLPLLQTMRFTYGTTISRYHSDANAYRLERLGGDFADFDTYLHILGMLPTTDAWQVTARDKEQTINSLNLDRRHWFENKLQYKKNGLNINIQNTFRLIYSRLDYLKGDYTPLHPDRHATEYYFGLDARYQTDSIGTFTLNYNYETSNPSLQQTITLPDNSNPLSISLGNPNLHKKHNNRLTLGYEYNFKHGQMLSLNMGAQRVTNIVTSKQTYNKVTGVTMSENVNLGQGYWNISPSLNFNTPLEKKKRIILSFSNYYTWQRQPQYSIATTGNSALYLHRAHNLYNSVNVSFNFGKLIASVGDMVYSTIELTDAPNNKRNTAIGNMLTANAQYTLPWDMSIKTNINTIYRHNGTSPIDYPWRTIWNVAITQSFLRNKTLALKFEASDLLNQRVQTWNYVSDNTRNSGWSKTVGRFFMLHVIYRFSTKKAAQ